MNCLEITITGNRIQKTPLDANFNITTRDIHQRNLLNQMEMWDINTDEVVQLLKWLAQNTHPCYSDEWVAELDANSAKAQLIIDKLPKEV